VKDLKSFYKFLPIFILISLIVVLAVSVVGFSVKFLYLSKTNAKMEKLEQALMDLRAAMNVDSIRQYEIQKIMAIIDRYNKDMPSHEKYDIANEIYNASVKYTNLDIDFICAVITQETGKTWDPKSISKAGARGLMQVMPATGMFLAKYEDITWTNPEEILLDPVYNIRIGTRYLSTLIGLYGVEGGLVAYNGGERLAARWLSSNKAKGILGKETRDYLSSVFKLYEEYKEIKL